MTAIITKAGQARLEAIAVRLHVRAVETQTIVDRVNAAIDAEEIDVSDPDVASWGLRQVCEQLVTDEEFVPDTDGFWRRANHYEDLFLAQQAADAADWGV